MFGMHVQEPSLKQSHFSNQNLDSFPVRAARMQIKDKTHRVARANCSDCSWRKSRQVSLGSETVQSKKEFRKLLALSIRFLGILPQSLRGGFLFGALAEALVRRY